MVPSFCDCSRRATVGETSVYSAASRSRRLRDLMSFKVSS